MAVTSTMSAAQMRDASTVTLSLAKRGRARRSAEQGPACGDATVKACVSPRYSLLGPVPLPNLGITISNVAGWGGGGRVFTPAAVCPHPSPPPQAAEGTKL